MTKNNDGKLYIKKQSFSEILNYIILFLPFTFGFLIDFIGLPNIVKYIIDVAWVIATIIIISKSVRISKQILPFFIVAAVFFLYTLTVYVCNFQSPFYYLWGFRNNFRFYFAFLAFITFFTEENANSCLKLFDYIFWVNAVVCMFQYLVLGLKQDYLGGVFGSERGCNAYLVVFFSIIISKSVLSYMNKEESTWVCFFKCVVTLMICALAELKFFFVLFVVILVAAIFLTAFTWRKLLLIIVGLLMVTVCSSVLVTLFGFEDFLSIDNLWSVATQSSYATAKDLNRLSAIPTLSKTIMKDRSTRLFGLGLGNCDTSSFAFCNTPFYETYSDLHYTWLSSAFLYLETGYLGLIMYISTFVVLFIQSLRLKIKKATNPLYTQMAMIMCIVCLILLIYNASMRTEIAYFVYFVLALPFIPSQKTISVIMK